MLRLPVALAAALLFSCVTERAARAPAIDPTHPEAPVPAAAASPDPLAPVQLVPDDEEKDEKKSPHEHHHHRPGGGQ
jgi:hypothetical protein